MLTIPANMQTALKKNPNQEFRYIIKMGRSLIASPYTASNFYFSSNATFGALNVGITDTSVYPVVPILLNEPQITENLDLRQHTSTVGGFSLDLDDNFKFQNPANANALEKFSDQLSKYNIYNKDLYIYLWLPGLTNLQTECLAIYQGVVGDHTISGGRVNIKISNSTFTIQKELPQSILTDSDAADGASLPVYDKGKAKPIIYGNHRFYFGSITDAAMTTANQGNNLVRSLYLGIDLSGKNRWLISNHEVESVDKIFAWDSTIQRYVNVGSFTVEQNTANGCIISTLTNPVLTDVWYGDGTVSSEANVAPGVWQNAAQANNKKTNDYASSIIAAGDAAVTKAQIDIDFSGYNPPVEDAKISTVRIYAKHWWSKGSALANADVNFRIYDIHIPNLTEASTITITNVVSLAATEASVNAVVTIRHDRDPKTGANTETTARVYEIWKVITYTTPNFLPLFFSGMGRKASATVAGHFSGLTENELLEIPAYIIDSIIYDELGQTIDTASMQAVATEQASWKIAPVIDTQQNSKDIIDKIAKQAMSFVYWNATNKAAMDTFYAANTTDYIFQTNDIQNRPLLYKSPLKDIVNDLVLKYKKDGNSGNLQSVITRIDDRAGIGSQAVYNAVLGLIGGFSADFISDATTAGLLADHWVVNDADSFWSVLHNVIEFETVDLRGVNFWNAGAFKPILGLELTDIIELHSDWDAKIKLYGATWASKQFKIFSITRLPDSLKIKAMSL